MTFFWRSPLFWVTKHELEEKVTAFTLPGKVGGCVRNFASVDMVTLTYDYIKCINYHSQKLSFAKKIKKKS